jgi:hypothetical protein
MPAPTGRAHPPLAILCYQRKPDAFDLCVVDVESKQVRQVTNTPKLDERHPVWGR